MKKLLKRFFGSKKAISWVITQGMLIALFYKTYIFYCIDSNILILFIGIEIISLILLGLVEFEKIIVKINVSNK